MRIRACWRHRWWRGALPNRVLDPVAPLFDFEKNDPELEKLDPAAKAFMGPRLSRLTLRGGPEDASPAATPAGPA